MTDCFELLGLPRRAVLGTEEVRAAFQSRGAMLHPDHARQETERVEKSAAFQALQEAFAILSATPRRLRHLLELHGHTAPRAAVIDESLMPLFSRVHTLLQHADTLLTKQAAATSALAKALLAASTLELESALAEAAGQLLQRSADLHEQLRAWDQAAPDLPALASNWQTAAFLEKWEAQLQQRRLHLLR